MLKQNQCHKDNGDDAQWLVALVSCLNRRKAKAPSGLGTTLWNSCLCIFEEDYC